MDAGPGPMWLLLGRPSRINSTAPADPGTAVMLGPS